MFVDPLRELLTKHREQQKFPKNHTAQFAKQTACGVFSTSVFRLDVHLNRRLNQKAFSRVPWPV
jgi:hypothetical protein